MKKVDLILVISSLSMVATPAFAGAPAPLPALGATGPIGLGVAVIGYVGYRVYRRK